MSSQILKKPIPYIALIFAHLIWGANFVVAKVTLQEFPPMSLALLRFAFASLLLAPFFLAETTHPSFGGKKVKIEKQDLPKLIATGVLIITLNITFFFEGIKRTTAINASILSLAIPMLAVLLGWWFLKEKVRLVNLFGIALGFIGAAVIIGLPQMINGGTTSSVILGNILIILASISWVAGATISKKILKIYSSLTVTAIAFLVGTISFLIPAATEYVQNPAWINQITILGILGLAYMTFLSSISAYFLFEWGLSKTSVIAADLFQYIEPFAATILAVSVLNETISTPFLLGASLIAIGVYLGTLAKEAHHRHHKAHRV
ncbi:MAG: EamA family transporter [Candidatus Daviesbacteria bacterium]|nr:EamA family transporter [Candidatus Daviesbacteria bacterium]